jgi:hypothetical protein
MRVMPNHPFEREHTMTYEESTTSGLSLQALIAFRSTYLDVLPRSVTSYES